MTRWPQELHAHNPYQLRTRKARVAGLTPPGLEPSGQYVWVGDHALPRDQHGITVLGAKWNLLGSSPVI